MSAIWRAWLEGLEPAMRSRAARLGELSPFFMRLAGAMTEAELATLGLPAERAPLPDASWSPRADEMGGASLETCQQALRRAKRRGLAHVIWHELGLHGDVARSWRALSAFADGLIGAALAMAERLLAARFGCVEGGAFAVIGLGKLGGGELNLGSDVDLLFVFDAPDGAASVGGRQSLPAREYFSRLARLLIRLLDEPTADGRAWAVDMRLRPGGDGAAIVASLAATLDFYREHGQTWERAMLLKARCAAGDAALGARLIEGLAPFVWRRHLDYTTVAALADMKRRIDAQAGDAEIAPGFDVKRGAGGIREIEFVAQALQLAHGADAPQVRCRGSREALAALARAGLLDEEDAAALDAAYLFWRRAEHALQARNGEQTHRLPPDFDDWLRAAGLWAEPAAEMRAHQARVHRIFRERLLVADAAREDAPRAWLDEGAPLPEFSAFAQGAEEAGRRVRRALARIEAHLRRDLLPERARAEIERFLDAAMPVWAQDANGVRAVEAFADLVRAIGGRATWLDLLAHHAGARDWLIGALAAADWVRDRIARDPSLLEWPLFQQGAADMRAIVCAIAGIGEEDEADALARLGRLTEKGRLFCALAADAHAADAEEIGVWLADLADAATAKALSLALRGAGAPRDFPFVALAMGKHGSREMGLASDLDMVFLVDAANAGMAEDRARDLAQRVGRRMIRMLSAPPPFGAGFAFDARLRPSGQAGALVSTLAAFEDYQFNQAWTWEHQALTRARVAAGEANAAAKARRIVREALDLPRDVAALARDVRAMRERMLVHRAALRRDHDSADLKHDAGGLVDLEFLAQFARLAWGASPAGDPAPTAAMLAALPPAAPAPWRERGARLAAICRAFRQAELMLRVELGRGAASIPLADDAPEWESLRRHAGLEGPAELVAMMRRVREDFTFLLDVG